MKKWRKNSSSRIYKTRHHNGSYVLFNRGNNIRNETVQHLAVQHKTNIIAAKNFTETEIKVSWSCLILLVFFTLSYYSFPSLLLGRRKCKF